MYIIYIYIYIYIYILWIASCLNLIRTQSYIILSRQKSSLVNPYILHTTACHDGVIHEVKG